MVLEWQRWRDEGKGSRRFNGVHFHGGKVDDHVIFEVPTLLYVFSHDWAKSPTYFNVKTFTLLQSYSNVNGNSGTLQYVTFIMITQYNI